MSTVRVVGVLLIILAVYLLAVAFRNKTTEWWRAAWA